MRSRCSSFPLLSSSLRGLLVEGLDSFGSGGRVSPNGLVIRILEGQVLVRIEQAHDVIGDGIKVGMRRVGGESCDFLVNPSTFLLYLGLDKLVDVRGHAVEFLAEFELGGG